LKHETLILLQSYDYFSKPQNIPSEKKPHGIPAGINAVENTKGNNTTIYDLNGVRLPEPKKDASHHSFRCFPHSVPMLPTLRPDASFPL